MGGIDDLLHTGGALRGRVAHDALDAIAGMRLLAAGDRVGAFIIRAELGRGGMAVVYAADRADGGFEQQVAIKWQIAQGGKEHIEQFRRERQILANLRHRHIARLLDGGETADGMLWFAMERIEGRPIDRYCAERGSNLRERLRLFCEVGDALAFAHARLLVHRDIKPANVLIDSDGGAKLVDFGIAHVLDAGHAAIDAHTPGFASPEQAAGAPSSISADIYSLGMLLRSLLHPNRGTDDPADLARSRSGVAARIGAVPELDAITRRAVAMDPAQRYPTVAAMLDDIHRFQNRQPVLAYPGGRTYRLSRFLSRHWAATAVGMVALSLIAVLSAGFVLRIRSERDQAALEAEKANAVTSFVVDLLRSADPQVHRGEKLSVLDVIGRGEAKADAELARQPDVHARLLITLANIQIGLSNYAQALRLNDRGIVILKSLPDPSPGQLAQRLQVSAQCAWRLEQFEYGLALLDEAGQYNAGSQRDPYIAVSILRTRATLLEALGRHVDAANAASAAVDVARRELEPGSPILGRALVGAAVSDEARADFAHALDKTREAADIFASSGKIGRNHPDSFVAHGNIALYLYELAEPQSALIEVESNLVRMKAVIGEDHARYIRQAALAARIALSVDQPEQALVWLKQARQGRERVQELGHHAWSDLALAEAQLALHEQRAADALAWYRKLDEATDGENPDARLGILHCQCLLNGAPGNTAWPARNEDGGRLSPRLRRLQEQVQKVCTNA